MAGVKFTNFASTTIATAVIAPGDLSFSVTAATGNLFPTIVPGEWFYVVLVDVLSAPTKREIVKVTGRSADVMTIVRAQEGTTAQSWIAGNFCACRPTNQGLIDLITTTASTVYGSLSSALVNFLQAGAGAVSRTVQDKNRDVVSVFDFMTVAQIADVQAGTLTIDVTAAWQAAHDSLPAAGGKLVINSGSHLVATVNLSKPVLLDFQGTLNTGCSIVAKNTTGNVLNVTNHGFSAKNIVITSKANQARTSGAYINLNNGGFALIDGFRFDRPYIGIESDGGSFVTIINGTMRNATSSSVAPGSAYVYLGRTLRGTANHISNLVTDTDLGATAALMPTYGIAMGDQDAPIINCCDIIHSGKDLALLPASGQSVSGLYCSDTFFDTADYGIYIAPAAGGRIVRPQFVNCWTGSHLQIGTQLTGVATGPIMGASFINHQSVINSNLGFYVSNQYCEDLVIDGGFFAQNTNSAILFDNNCKKFTVRNARVGASNDLTANGSGIVLGTGCTNYSIHDNNLSGNTGAGYVSSSTAASGSVYNNIGYNPVGGGGITVGASPYTYTAGNSPETVYINQGTVSLITINGVAAFGQTNVTAILPPNGTVVVTYSVIPFMNKYVA